MAGLFHLTSTSIYNIRRPQLTCLVKHLPENKASATSGRSSQPQGGEEVLRMSELDKPSHNCIAIVVLFTIIQILGSILGTGRTQVSPLQSVISWTASLSGQTLSCLYIRAYVSNGLVIQYNSPESWRTANSPHLDLTLAPPNHRGSLLASITTINESKFCVQ